MSYISGSDLLVFVGGAAIGHSSTCTVTYGTDTKERAVKPLASIVSATAGKWTEKNVSKLNVQISAEGFAFSGEAESGFDELVQLWQAAAPVVCKYCHRASQNAGFWTGSFVISNLAETAPAGDDATYSISLESTGEVTYQE